MPRYFTFGKMAVLKVPPQTRKRRLRKYSIKCFPVCARRQHLLQKYKVFLNSRNISCFSEAKHVCMCVFTDEHAEKQCFRISRSLRSWRFCWRERARASGEAAKTSPSRNFAEFSLARALANKTASYAGYVSRASKNLLIG